MSSGWRELGLADFEALAEPQRAVIGLLLEQARRLPAIHAVQVERDARGLVVVSVWVGEVSAAVVALLDEAQADGQRAGVSFVACRADGMPRGAVAPAGATWLVAEPAAGRDDS